MEKIVDRECLNKLILVSNDNVNWEIRIFLGMDTPTVYVTVDHVSWKYAKRIPTYDYGFPIKKKV